MSQVVDNKVVQMEFDNSRFEQNVQQSMGTLDKLKAKLNFDGASKSLNEVDRAAHNMDLSGIAAGVEALQNRFSTFGIVGMTVVQNLTTSVMNLGSRMVSFAKNAIVGGGMRRAQNIENAHFMLQGLVKDEKTVQAIMDRAMVSVDQTAYGYDEAAKAAAMFTASGLTVKQLDKPLKAITGVAAVTNSEYERVSQIFTTVAGNGRLMGDQLLSLSSMGLNAAATIADYFNATSKGSKKTEKDIRDMVSKGEIDFKTFANAMSWAFGDQAKKANETVNGVVSNIKAAFSRIGADFISPLIEQNGPLVKLLNEVRERLNQIRKLATSPAAELITKQINAALTGMRNFIKLQSEAGFFHWLSASILETFRIISDIAKIAYNIIRPIITAIGDVIEPQRIIANLLWAIRTGLDGIKNATSGKNFDILTSIFSNLAYVISAVIEPLTRFILGFATAMKGSKMFKNTLEKVLEILYIFTDKLANGVDKLMDFSKPFSGFVSSIGEGISKLIDSIRDFNLIDKFKKAIVDLAKAVKTIFKDVFGGSDFNDGFNFLNAGIFVAGIKVIDTLFKKYRGLKFEGLGFLSGSEKVFKMFSKDIPDTLFEMQRKLKADQIMGIAKAIAVLAGSLMLISLINPKRLASGLVGISTLFEILGAFYVLTTKVTAYSKGFMGLLEESIQAARTTRLVALLNGVGTAILLLAGAMKVLASIDADGIGRGVVAIGLLLLELDVFSHNVNMKSFTRGALGLIALSIAINILAIAVKQFAKMDTEAMFKGLMGVAGALATVLLSMKLMPEKGMIATGIGLIAVATGLLIISKVLKSIGTLDNDVLNKGLGGLAGLLMELAIALQVMKGTLGGSAALLIASVAILALTPALLLLSSVSWEGLGKSLLLLAGAFTIIGVAGALMQPVIPVLVTLAATLLGLSASVALFGAGMFLLGAGLTAISVGISSLAATLTVSATALITALKILFAGILSLIPTLIKGLVTAISESLLVILAYVPKIIDGIGKFILEALVAFEKYIPPIADHMITFLIKIINVVAERIPEIMGAFIDLLAAIFNSLAAAFKNIDTEALFKGTIAVGLMAGLTYILSSIVSMIPMAMVGLIGMGAMVAELSLILAAIGKLSEISGLSWLVTEGGNFLQLIGTAIGQFIGGIVGGIGQGVTASLPALGINLSQFMTNLQPFLAGASTINPAMAEGIKSLAAAILMITAADVLDSVTSWLTGGVDMAEFASKLVPFGEGIKAYSQSVAGMDPKAVKTSAQAAKGLTELAKAIPNSGGLISLFTGDNDLGKFGPQLQSFGTGLKEYSMAVVGIDIAGIQNAEKAVKSMVSTINSTAEVDASGVSSFKSAVSSLGQVQADQMARAFKSNAGQLTNAGQSMTSALKKGLSSGKGEITSAASSLAETASKAFSSGVGNMTAAGSKLISGIVKGLKSGKESVKAEVRAIASAAAAVAKGYYDSFYEAGKSVTQGYADGITAKKSTVVSAAQAVARAAQNALKKADDTNSPSRVYYQFGKWAVEGYAKGMNDNVRMATGAATSMAGDSVKSFSKALSSLSTIVGDEMDANPTITPVLDLSAVQEGSGYISNMLDMASTIGLDANTGAINNLFAQNARNAVTNSDVVSAIGKLERSLGNISGDTYNIDGVTYDDGSNISEAVGVLVNAAKVARRN